MGKGSKPSTPGPSAQETALADISIDIANEYKDRYRGLESDLLRDSTRDRTSLAQGRSNVDTQKAVSADNSIAVARGASSGGMGSGASLANYDAASTGGALATSNQESFTAGQQDNAAKLGSAVGAVQGGQDISFAGIRDAASVGNQNTINKFQADQTRKIQNAQLAENVISGAVSGYMKGKSFDANRTTMNDMANSQINDVQNQYFSAPMQLAPPQQPFSLYQPPGTTIQPYSLGSTMNFGGPNSVSAPYLRLGMGVRK